MNNSELYEIAKKYEDRGNIEKAYEHLLQGEERNPCGFYYLARLYDEGHAVEQDRDKAIELYRKTIALGAEHEEYGEDGHATMAKERLDELSIAYREVQ
jgi:TPR repeat protein